MAPSAEERTNLSPSSNDARALHELLVQIGTGATSPTTAWSTVLEADYQSLEFTRRHAEVCALYLGTLEQLDQLPERSRQRFQRYATHWWYSIVAPQHAWSTNVQMDSVVETNALDQLGSAADLIEARMEGSLAVAASLDLEGLRSVCEEWLQAISDDDDLSRALKDNLLQDLHHIVWLIEQEHLFGTARVTAATSQALGSLTVAGETLPAPKRGEWLARVKKLTAALVLLGGLHAGVDTSVMLVEGAAHAVAELAPGAPSPPVAPQAPGAPGQVGDTPDTDDGT